MLHQQQLWRCWATVHCCTRRLWTTSLHTCHTDWRDRDGASTARQAVLLRFTADVHTKAEHWSLGRVPVLPLLLVSAARRCSVTHEGSIHHADSEEGRHGLADVKSYRPISNLSVVCKLLERLVANKQLVNYLRDNHLLPDRQSA